IVSAERQQILPLALAKRRAVPNLQTNVGQSQADESQRAHGPSGSRRFSVSRTIAPGPRRPDGARGQRSTTAAQRPQGPAGDSRGDPQRHRQFPGTPTVANLLGTPAKNPPRPAQRATQ